MEQEQDTKPNSKLKMASERQIAIVRLIALGKTDKQVADIICVSEATVSWHLGKLYKLWKVRTRSEAVAYAGRNNLLIDSASETAPNSV